MYIMRKYVIGIIMLAFLHISQAVHADVDPTRVMAPDADFIGSEIAIRATIGENKWISVGAALSSNLTEDHVFVVEQATSGSGFVLKGKSGQGYVKKCSAAGDLLSWTAGIDQAAVFTVAYADNVTDESNVRCPASVSRDNVIRFHTTDAKEGVQYMNSNGGNQVKFANGRGAWSALLAYDVKGLFDLSAVYQPSFRPVGSVDELEDGVTYVIRNCFVDGSKGDRSGYLHMERPMTVTKGMNTITASSLFQLHRTEEGQFSFSNNGMYIPNNGSYGETLAPSQSEAFYEVLPVEAAEGLFNFKSSVSDKTLYMNANVGSLTFWYETPHPYQFYTVKEVTDFEAKAVRWNYVDEATGVVVKTVEKKLYTHTYPTLQDLKAELPAGFTLLGIDGVNVDAVEAPETVSAEKLSYTMTIATRVSITAAGYGTLYSGVALQIPFGVSAYTGVVDETKGVLALTELDGVIPANTAVVLKAAPGTYTFSVTTMEGTAPQNDLKGSLTNISKPSGSGTVYTLQQIDGAVAFYKYLGANMQPCRAYLVLPESFSLQSITLGDFAGTTGIDSLPVAGRPDSAGKLFDLSGREVKRVVRPSVYIQDGKKVWVNP